MHHHGKNILKSSSSSCSSCNTSCMPRAANEINVNGQHGLPQLDKDEFKRHLVDLYHAVGGACKDVGPVRYIYIYIYIYKVCILS